MFCRKFRFTPDTGEKDAVSVSPEMLYEPERGYGFVTEQNRWTQELLRISELNGGWEPLYWLAGQQLGCLMQDEGGCFLDSERIMAGLEEKAGCRMEGEKRLIPLCFQADVPRHGNYRVKLSVTGEPGREILIFAGCRRLFFRGRIPDDGRLEYSMTVNVCAVIPRGKREVYEKSGIDVSIAGEAVKLRELEIGECLCPTIYIAGDSTVTDQSASYPYAPGTSYCGWGQMLPCFLDGRIAVSNHAHSGLTTESFRSEGHYAMVERYRKAGDYCFFQFGHNDQKLMELKASGGYRENLLRYIRECRERQCFPVLVTPVARNSWKGNGGGYNDLLREYAQVCREVGRVTGTPVVDLHRRSMELIRRMGLEESRPFFYPGDYTHSNDYGAYRTAGYAAEEIVRVCRQQRAEGSSSFWEESAYAFLAECVSAGFGEWKPAEKICLPKKPEQYGAVPDPEGSAELFENLERPEELLTRAEALDFLIRTAKFFPTNVYNDLYADVAGHEWYAGAVECACQNGIIPPELTEDGKLFPERTVTLEEFLMLAVSAYASRRRLPAARENPYAKQCRAGGERFVAGACAAGLICADGSEDLTRPITRARAAGICRKMEL